MKTSSLIPSLTTALMLLSMVDVYGDTEMKNTFKIESWDESPFLEFDGGVKYSRATLMKQYSGAITGQGQLEYLMVYNEGGAAQFTGIEHFDGRIDGRTGTLAMMHEGTFSDGSVSSTFRIIDGSQSPEFVGMTGEGSYQTGHSMVVEFDFSHFLSRH